MTLTFKLACWLISLLCFAVAGFFGRAWYGVPPNQYAWVGGSLIAVGLFFFQLGNIFG